MRPVVCRKRQHQTATHHTAQTRGDRSSHTQPHPTERQTSSGVRSAFYDQLIAGRISGRATIDVRSRRARKHDYQSAVQGAGAASAHRTPRRATAVCASTAASRSIIVFAGVDGAGKSETVNILNAWMDPRWIVTTAFGDPSDEESERPPFWRYWRALPPRGRVGLYLSSWYSPPLVGPRLPSHQDRRVRRCAGAHRAIRAGA